MQLACLLKKSLKSGKHKGITMQEASQRQDDAFSREIERIINKEVSAERLRGLLESPASFDHSLWELAVNQGWPGLAIPQDAGGLGLSWRDLADVAEVFGRTAVSLPIIQNTLVAKLLLNEGESAESRAIAKQLAEGRLIVCLPLFSPDDAGLPESPTLVISDGKVTGTCAFTAYAAVADFALVRAGSGNDEVMALVSLKDNAVQRTTANLIDNARAAASLNFQGSVVSVLACSPKHALMPLLSTLVVITAFEQIAGAAKCLDMARAYALEHKAFGQVIGAFQAIKHKLSDMYTGIEIAKGCALEALEELDSGEITVVAAAAARIAANRAYDFAAQECIQVHGGMGVMWEQVTHHYYRRARSLALETGSTAYWRNELVERLINDQGEKV
jgi:alkylation response protein AidB-like acyl-CoA dehydrogenase